MAYSIKNAILLSFLATICLPSIVVTTTYAKKHDIIKKICFETKMPCFCLKELRTDGRSKGANFTSLAGILLDKIEPRVYSMKDMINSFLNQTGLPVEEQLQLSMCLDECNEAIVDVSWCRHALKSGSGDFKGLKSQAFSLFKHFRKCDKSFKKQKPEPREIEKASGRIQELCSAVLVISKFGMRKHPFDVCSGFNCVTP
nr:pectinesterase inhibitor-like [Ipomoea batatas]